MLRKIYGSVLIAMVFITGTSFGQEKPKAIPTVFIKLGPYMLTEADMPDYQLSQKSLQTWPTNKKDGPYSRMEMGARQLWTSAKVSDLIVKYGQFETAEEALESATLSMKSSKRQYQTGSLTWQKEEDKSWTSSVPDKESIVYVRGKITLVAEGSVSSEANRKETASELEHSILKVLGKIESAAKK